MATMPGAAEWAEANNEYIKDAIRADVAAAATGAQVPDALVGVKRQIEAYALEAALGRFGIDLDLIEKNSAGEWVPRSISKEELGRALGRKIAQEAALDVDLGDVLDRTNVRRVLDRVACKYVLEALGMEGSPTAEGVRSALQRVARSYVEEQIGQGAGALLDAALPEAAALRALTGSMRAVVRGRLRQQPVDMSPKGINNRERQRRYRETHNRRWEPIE